MAQQLAAFGTYFLGFAARPIGAVIFGHYGDRIGRKTTLIATLLTMGLATFAMGLSPTYANIGVWGAILISLLRVLQGIGVGGEWGGSVLLSMEWGHRGKRGFYGSWPQFGVPVGLVTSIGAVSLMSALTGPNYLVWGWRVPFLASIALVAVGLWIRLGILENPVFEKILSAKLVEPAPVLALIQRQWREVVLSALIRTGQQAPFYIFTAYVITYATATLKFNRGVILNDVLIMSTISLFTIPIWGYVSDIIGRKLTYLIGAAAMFVFSIPYWALLDTRNPVLVLLVIVVSLPFIHDIQYAPQAAFIAEAFTGRLRYSGASLGYQLASVTAGGPAPLIAITLLSIYHNSLAIAFYMMVCALISFASAAVLRERSKDDISVEYQDLREARLASPKLA